jgi:hypothetical protein
MLIVNKISILYEDKMDIKDKQIKCYQQLSELNNDLIEHYKREAVAYVKIISLLKDVIRTILDMLYAIGRADIAEQIKKNISNILE